ncbi:MAG: Gfo/Idh/MocA family protein [Chloroflexota bacterium]
MSLTVGMIGLAHPHSAMHLRTLEASDEVLEIIVCDPDPVARQRATEACRKAGPAFAEVDAVLDRRDVPVIFVALPNAETAAVVERSARAGKHVICEKPCARSLPEFQPALGAIRERGTLFTACYVWRVNPAILQMKALVDAGALGRLTSVELRMVTTQVKLRDPAHWLFKRDAAGGGIVSWLGCHWLDLLRFLTGQEVCRVSALIDTVSGEAIDVEDVASVSMKLSGGAIASLYAGYLLAVGRPGYEGGGYDQSIILRGTEGALAHQRVGDEQVVTLESDGAGWRAAPRQVFRFTLGASPAYGGVHGLRFVDDFIRAAAGAAGAIHATANDAARVLEVLDAIYLSAERGRVVDLG